MNAAARFGSDLLARIDAAREVEIETTRPSGASRRTVIWVMTDGAEVYVRSVGGVEGRWYRDLMDRPIALLHLDDERVAVEAGIALSVLTLGAAILLAWRAPTAIALLIVGAFGMFHGHAHGTELPESATPAAYLSLIHI